MKSTFVKGAVRIEASDRDALDVLRAHHSAGMLESITVDIDGEKHVIHRDTHPELFALVLKMAMEEMDDSCPKP